MLREAQGNYRLASHVAISAAAKNTSRVQSVNRTQAIRPRRVPNSLLFLLLVSRWSLLLTKFRCLAKSTDVRLRWRISASSADFASSVSDWRSQAICSSSSSLSSAYSCGNSANMGYLGTHVKRRSKVSTLQFLVGIIRAISRVSYRKTFLPSNE
jgi:hypothetical protein